MVTRAKAVQESFEGRQTSTADALAELFKMIEGNEKRKQQQVAKGLDALTYFLVERLTEAGISNAESTSRVIAAAFGRHPSWRRSESELREVRKEFTFALLAEDDDMEKVISLVESVFGLLARRTVNE